MLQTPVAEFKGAWSRKGREEKEGDGREGMGKGENGMGSGWGWEV